MSNENDVNFTEISPDELRTQAIEMAEKRTGELLYPGDERRIFVDVLIYVLSWIIGLANKMCRARLLPYASGYQLDALGDRVNCKRISPVPASVMLKFTLETLRPNDITIPAGTTVTADNKVLFATDKSAIVPAGKLTVENVQATATIGGAVTNGIPAGAIQSFVDRVPYVTGVVNITESSGGSAGEPYPESIDPENGDDGTGDNNYRQRIKLAPSAYSAAGSAASYEYHARGASAEIESVAVTSDAEAGRVDIYVTERGGAMPSEGTLAAVYKAVTADDIKPLNDYVEVHAPREVPYDIDVTYYVLQEDESESRNAIEGQGGAIDQYNAWQCGKIGRDINPDHLRALMLPHCQRIDVTAPYYSSVSNAELARFSGRLNVQKIIVNE